VILANAARQGMKNRRGNAISLGNVHAEIAEFSSGPLIGEPLQRAERPGLGPFFSGF
jgi:hypothetical protein